MPHSKVFAVHNDWWDDHTDSLWSTMEKAEARVTALRKKQGSVGTITVYEMDVDPDEKSE